MLIVELDPQSNKTKSFIKFHDFFYKKKWGIYEFSGIFSEC